MKKHALLFVASIFIISLLLLFESEVTLPSLATDSGWDTSYDSGWDTSYDSGSYDSGSWSSDSSWTSHDGYSGTSHSRRKNGSSNTGGDFFIFLVLFIVIFIISIFEIIKKIREAKQIKNYESQYEQRIEGIKEGIDISMFAHEGLATLNDKVNGIEISEEDKSKLEKAYQIYLDVQEAWMNFDYDKLKELVTDELYNIYYNQLQALELKGQKNIMSDFSFHNSHIISKNIDNGITTMKVRLMVSFYDYVVDKEENILRGNKNRKVEMTYVLTFVYQETASNKCPNCGADKKEEELVCPYCNTKMQTVTKEMRLSKKECVRQR